VLREREDEVAEGLDVRGEVGGCKVGRGIRFTVYMEGV